jgi:hypothetical protein
MNDEKNIIKYIKDNYPKVIFNKVNLSNVVENKKALGFVVTDNKFIIGYISKDGSLCKLVEPIDLNNISHSNFITLIKQIPVVDGFDENDKNKLINLLDEQTETISQEQLINELKEYSEQTKLENENLKGKLETLDSEYKMLVNVSNNDKLNMILVKTERDNQIKAIKKEYDDKIKEIDLANKICKDKLLYEKDLIVDAIKNYKEQVEDYIKKTINNSKDVDGIVEKLKAEKAEIEKNLTELSSKEDERLKKLQDEADQHTDFSYQLNEKHSEIEKLNNIINTMKNELKDVQERFSKSKIENQMLKNFKSKCLEQILSEKDTIIRQIKEYNDAWLVWAKENEFNTASYKQKLNNELSEIYEKLKLVFNHKKEYISTLNLDRQAKTELISNLNNNISEIKAELNKAVTTQLQELSIIADETSSSNSSELLEEKDSEIKELKSQLENLRSLLEKNANSTVKKQTDYDDCYNTLQRFISVNNMFFRKKEIMNILDNIIFNDETMSLFRNLNETIKNNIKTRYEVIRNDIYKHIDFLNLAEYVNSPNIQLFKSKSTTSKIPPQFCEDLNHISDYWDENVGLYRHQDDMLTNIYEDISGAVRVYIKIKPLIGIEQKNNTVFIETIQNKKQKKVVIDCSLAPNLEREIKKQSYGNFYGVFDETFSNLDVYTGTEGSKSVGFKTDIDEGIENPDTVSPGLYSTFKQVEDGYSIVLFGYGLSGSGKTRLLVGESNVPGLIHYGLANLKDVANIKVKYLFEQYIDKFTPTLNTISGKIHNLVNKVPQLSEEAIRLTVDETQEFDKVVPSNLNLNNISVDDLYTLTSVLEKYRVSKGRVKKTPNNPVSSRSHLYVVFEVKFLPKDGFNEKTGYITLVDTAGRESPMDIYDLFIDNGGRYKTNLTTILGPTGGPGVVENYLKKEYQGKYKPTDIYNILKEGVYINETINHLVYFFNKKNYKKTNVELQKSLDTYSNSKFYVNPKKEENCCQGSNNVLTIPIMKFLDTLSNKNLRDDDFKPTKFVVFVCLRKDQTYCNQIFSSMEFASSVKSS